MPCNQIAYIELPAANTQDLKAFYSTLFGWSFEDWGPGYAAFSESGVGGGINAEPEHRTKAPLVVIETDDIRAMEKRVQQTGGTVTLPTFNFPGGSRFHFTDPGGNELAVMQVA